MKLRPSLVMVALFALTTMVLGGCTAPPPVMTPVPMPEGKPTFASDEEALAAAVEAYAEYLETTDEITSEGGIDPSRIGAHVTAEQLEREIAGFRQWEVSGVESRGKTSFDRVKLQQYDSSNRAIEYVVIYLCLDSADSSVVDSTGSDVTPSDRPSHFPLEVQFEVEAQFLKVSRSEPWPSAAYCQ